jgi:hypothetical protein
MKSILTALVLVGLLHTTNAQKFDVQNPEGEYQLQRLINRYGTSERIYLNDASKKTFDATPGNTYLVVFAYASKDKSTRRMMVYEIGPDGAKHNPRYPDYSKGYRSDKGTQAFAVRLDPKGESTVKYKIDANASAAVFIYKVTPGVKRDM